MTSHVINFHLGIKFCPRNYAVRQQYDRSLSHASHSAVPSFRVDKVLTEDIVILELYPTTFSSWSGDKKAFKEGAGEMATTVTSKVRSQQRRDFLQCFSLGRCNRNMDHLTDSCFSRTCTRRWVCTGSNAHLLLTSLIKRSGNDSDQDSDREPDVMPKKTADKPTARSGKRDAGPEAPAAPALGDSSSNRGPRNPRRGPRGANEGGMKEFTMAYRVNSH